MGVCLLPAALRRNVSFSHIAPFYCSNHGSKRALEEQRSAKQIRNGAELHTAGRAGGVRALPCCTHRAGQEMEGVRAG